MIVGKKYREDHVPTISYTMTQSVEPGGTFMVKNYPDSFTETIDNCIAEYVQKVLSKPKKKSPQKIDTKRQRTRKPVPAYTTKK